MVVLVVGLFHTVSNFALVPNNYVCRNCIIMCQCLVILAGNVRLMLGGLVKLHVLSAITLEFRPALMFSVLSSLLPCQ